MPNTTTDWDVTISNEIDEHHPNSPIYFKVAHALSSNGRVEVGVTRDDSEDGCDYIITVYESDTYMYYISDGNPVGEFVDHDAVAHVYPSDAEEGWATSWSEAVELFTNALTSIERDNKWLSDPLTADRKEYFNFHMFDAGIEFESLLTEYGDDELSMVEKETPPSDDVLDLIHEKAVENNFSNLAAVIEIGGEEEVESLYEETFGDPV